MNLTPEQQEKVNEIDMAFGAAGIYGFASSFHNLIHPIQTEAMDKLNFTFGDYKATLADRVKWFCYDLIYKPLLVTFRIYRWLKKVIVDAWEDSEE